MLTHPTRISHAFPSHLPVLHQRGWKAKHPLSQLPLHPGVVHDTILANDTKGDIYPGLLGWALISC